MRGEHYTVGEASQIAGVSEGTVRKYCDKGVIRYKRDAKRKWRWIHKDDAEKLKGIFEIQEEIELARG